MSPASRPTYLGRPLPRPDEELVDQGLPFDLSVPRVCRSAPQALAELCGELRGALVRPS